MNKPLLRRKIEGKPDAYDLVLELGRICQTLDFGKCALEIQVRQVEVAKPEESNGQSILPLRATP